MPRPKNASYRSHRLIYEALSSGPKYFEELHNITSLHRNTLATRLKFLISEGLIQKRRDGRRVYYEIIEPLTDENGFLRREGLKWLKHIVKTDRAEERERRRRLKAVLREETRSRKLIGKMFDVIENFHASLDRLLNLPESQELLDLIENWQSASIPRLWLILVLNKWLVDLNSDKLICPQCYYYGTREDYERNEIICERCGFVIRDEIIPPRERLEMILGLLERYSNQLSQLI